VGVIIPNPHNHWVVSKSNLSGLRDCVSARRKRRPKISEDPKGRIKRRKICREPMQTKAVSSSDTNETDRNIKRMRNSGVSKF